MRSERSGKRTVSLSRARRTKSAGFLDMRRRYRGGCAETIAAARAAAEQTRAGRQRGGDGRDAVARRAGPDANCDGLVNAADVTALIERLPSGDPGACGADVVRDGTVTTADLPPLISVLFES
jgi:hypothetical protein